MRVQLNMRGLEVWRRSRGRLRQARWAKTEGERANGRPAELDRARRLFRALRCVVGVLLASVGVSASAHADQASGTWTGELEAHGNYYLENSTRVIIPTGRLALEAPNGIRMSAAYLADVIASASIAQSGRDEDAVHTEVRQAVRGAVGKLFPVGDQELDVSAQVTRSWESDYFSWLYGARVGYGFNQKASSLSLSATGVSDSIYANQSVGDQVHAGDLNGITIGLGFSQVLSPVLLMSAGYQLVYLSGYLGNPYRRAKIGPLPYPEDPPETRVRHNVEGQISWYLPPTRTTLQAYTRLYTDSWELSAITPEARVYQALGSAATLRLRFRYYKQTEAYFVGDTVDSYPAGYTGPLTADPKLSAFYSVQIGARLAFSLRALESTALDFVSRGSLDISFDHQWTQIPSASFGRKNLFVIVGGRLPF